MSESSEFLRHESCEKCDSSDAKAVYTDHTYCFSCEHYEGEGSSSQHTSNSELRSRSLVPVSRIAALTSRGITEKTCRKWGYGMGTFRFKDKPKAEPVQIANYRSPDGERVVAQKIRGAEKDFTIVGDIKQAGLYGQWLWRDGGKYLVITEGEIDALSVSEAQDNKWAVVSIPTGSTGARKAIEAQLTWVEKFEKVILMFDMDEAGQKAAREVALTLEPGKAFIAQLPLKDANEMLKAGRTRELIAAIFEAKAYRPDGLVDATELYEQAKQPVQRGIDWPWPTLTRETYGRRRGEVYLIGAGTGVGKTDLFTQLIAYTVKDQDLPVAAFFLEQPPIETIRRIAGKLSGLRLHVPDDGWTEAELCSALAEMPPKEKLFLYNHFGGTDWTVIRSLIRYAVKNYGIQDIFIDHLTALAAGSDKPEKEALEELMEDIASLAQELNISVYMISHLSTPEGKPHEEGGRVTIRHFKGSRAIGFWAHFMFGMERDQQADSETARHTTTFRILKDRYTGQSTGKTFNLRYDAKTGLLEECGPDEFESTPSAETDGEPDF